MLKENILRQYKKAEKNHVLIDLSTQEDILKLSGPEKENFLNAYNTQNIKTLKPMQSTYGCFLTQKGKLVSDARILRTEEDFFLFLPQSYGVKILKHLEVFLNFAEVEMRALSSPWTHLACLGPEASNFLANFFKKQLGQEQVEKNYFQNSEILIWSSARWLLPSWEIFCPNEQPDLFSQLLHTTPESQASSDLLDIFRIEAGYPKMGIDMDENSLVAEVGLDLRATSFNKGCYLGQETTARVHSIGKVNRQLYSWSSSEPCQGSLPVNIVNYQDHEVGQLTSWTYSPKFKKYLGLGYATNREVAEETRFKLENQNISLQILNKP